MLNELLPPWLIWFLLGIALACSELFMPAFILFFFGIGCLGVACVLLFWDITLNQQLLVFLLITIGSLVILRKTLIRIFRGVRTDSQDKEFDDFPYKERVVVLRAILPPNPGRVQHRGTAWDAVGMPWPTRPLQPVKQWRSSGMPRIPAKHFTSAGLSPSRNEKAGKTMDCEFALVPKMPAKDFLH